MTVVLRRSAVVGLIGVAVVAAGLWLPRRPTAGVQFVYRLDPEESVFAYARISPDGRFLAYASEAKRIAREPLRTVRIVDLARDSHAPAEFEEPGIDPYWSPAGDRVIFLSLSDEPSVSILDWPTRRVARNIAPPNLGDYFSWGKEHGRDFIVTITGNYYYLSDNRATNVGQLPSCPDIGPVLRPLVSKDGRRVSVFANGLLWVRNAFDCDRIITTNMPGAKADFSWDGRYVAYHAPKPHASSGYDIWVVDLEERTRRQVTHLRGSSLFPSWTRDGRLCFRYDGPEFRGFAFASNILQVPVEPLPETPSSPVSSAPRWRDVFSTPPPTGRVAIVLIWAPWGAHCPTALRDLALAELHMRARGWQVAVAAAAEPSSWPPDVARLIEQTGFALPQLTLPRERLLVSGAQNQIPTTLMFVDGLLSERRLGAMTADGIMKWVGHHYDTN